MRKYDNLLANILKIVEEKYPKTDNVSDWHNFYFSIGAIIKTALNQLNQNELEDILYELLIKDTLTAIEFLKRR